MSAATIALTIAGVVTLLALAALLALRKIENERNDREEEPEVNVSKRFLAMMNRLPLRGQRLAWVDFNRGGYTQDEEADGRVILDPPLEEANVITSLVDIDVMTGRRIVGAEKTTGRSDITLHRIVVDVDHPVTVVESSTPGHSHLYVDLMLPWEELVKLLEVMADIGLVEPGYVNASKARGYTAVRLPWVSKSELTDEEVMGA